MVSKNSRVIPAVAVPVCAVRALATLVLVGSSAMSV